MKFTIIAGLAFSFVMLGCSRTSPEELMAKAEEARQAQNVQEEMGNYHLIMNDHPRSPLAEEALIKLASIYNNQTSQYDSAIIAYRSYVGKYPDGQNAPMAMFLVGFLYHNQTRQLDSAEIWYKKFIEKYPDHEMTMSAQFEVMNLGKSPEELLPTIDTPDEKPVAAKSGADKRKKN